jgi:hypothetical protein
VRSLGTRARSSWGETCALSVESELIHEDGDWLGAGVGSWGLSSLVDLLLHSVADGLMGRHERFVQLLALEVKVTGRGYHAQDHEGVPY